MSRSIAMGGEALMEGFALLGFETYPGASASEVESLLGELLASGEQAMVFLEQGIAYEDARNWQRVRGRSGRVVVVEVPPLPDPGAYRSSIDELLERVRGAAWMERAE